MSLWDELRRRDVFRVAAAYLVASWLIVQVVGVLTEPLGLPDALDTVVVVLLAIGFPFALVFAWVYEVTPEGIRVTSDTVGSRASGRAPRQRLTYVVIALLVLTVAIMVLDNYVLAPPAREVGAGSRIAILPCDDLSPDPTDSFFAVGIHEELLNRLGVIQGLEVISRTSVLQYAGSRPPIPQIAEALNVDAVMECSARYSGDRVLLTTQLIDGVSDAHLWADSYPADMSDPRSLFEMQAEIAMRVAESLRIEFLGIERDRIERVSTESGDAYALYLAAFDTPNLDRQLELLEQALTIDDRFVDAWIRQANVYNIRAGFLAGAEADADRALAIESSRRAVEADPESAPAHAVLAASLGQNGAWTESELAARRAVALGGPPGNPLAKLSVAYFRDAAEALEDVLRVNPMSSGPAALALMAYAGLGDEAARQRHWERGEALHGEAWLGRTFESLLRLGDRDREFVRTRAPDSPIWRAGVANLDMPDSGIAAMRSLYTSSDARTAVLLRELSAWAAYFGDPALSLEWLRESTELQPSGILNVWLPLYADVRREAGFKDVVSELGLTDFWNRFGWPDICRPVGDDDFECR